ncbi:MAG: hypothetical protein WC124_00830 [Desulfoplanes sp.]
MKKTVLVLGMVFFAWMFLVTSSHAYSGGAAGWSGEQSEWGGLDWNGGPGDGGNSGEWGAGPGAGDGGCSGGGDNGQGEWGGPGHGAGDGGCSGDGDNGQGEWHGDNGHHGHHGGGCNPPAVPIPGVVWLLGSGIAGLLTLRRNS